MEAKFDEFAHADNVNDEKRLLALETKESLELTKSAKGTYNWKIKLKEDDLTDETLKKLEKINKELEGKYGASY